jgi:glucose-6-phosphate 1-epimerase
MQAQSNLVNGKGNLPMLQVETEWSTAEIYLHGGHLTHFQKKGEPPLLWMSQSSKFDEQSPIRGGIPIILPWFGGRDGSLAHGFARVRNWELKATTFTGDGTAKIHLHLPTGATVAGFAPFITDYIVTVGKTLELELRVTNLSTGESLAFEECLHTYFTVGDIAAVSIAGLRGVKYLDKVAGGVEKTETGDVIQISSEVDRVYQDTTDAVEISDGKLKRKIRVEKQNSHSTVVWNPWIAKSKAMADFGDEEYHGMVCVESGNVGKNKLTVAAGKQTTLKVKLSSENPYS